MNILLLYHNWTNNKNTKVVMFINFAMNIGMCVSKNKKIFLVRNNREKESGQLVLTCVFVRVCASSGMYVT